MAPHWQNVFNQLEKRRLQSTRETILQKVKTTEGVFATNLLDVVVLLTINRLLSNIMMAFRSFCNKKYFGQGTPKALVDQMYLT